jgi:primosomal protein N' (replication factor Y)
VNSKVQTSGAPDSQLFQIAVDAPLFEPLTYKCPLDLIEDLQIGATVVVPLGKRTVEGIVVGKAEQTPNSEASSQFKIKEIISVKKEQTILPSIFLKWILWLADYYHYPLGRVLSLAHPPLEKFSKRKSTKKPLTKSYNIEDFAKPSLTAEQESCYKNIQAHNGYSTHLLHGVTGSGKTEVYLRLLEDLLAKGQQGLVLVPEISLTPQLVDRFAKRFGEKVAVMHSQLTEREKTNQWWEMVDEKKSILVGARSALFCPIPKLGMIIVDEEHETSFKQDEKLKYNARDAAVMRGFFSQCPVILGSATPSLETWKNVLDKKYHLHQMKHRVNDIQLPTVKVIDLKASKAEELDTFKYAEKPIWLSNELYEALVATYENQMQSALFLNRRGMSPLVFCESCGHTKECPNCDIALTLHAHSHLVCHYCDYHEHYKIKCSDCKEGELKPMGLGTEQIEEDLKKLFPNAQIARADRDEIQNREDLENLIQNMESGQIDILIGTQMIAKGLDFPKLKTVGLVLADIGFNLPDFRATEKAFQLITQVSGRAGRHLAPGEDPGKVFIQTYNTEHMSLEFALTADFEGFAEKELQMREILLYPPFGKMTSIRIQGSRLDRVQESCRLLSSAAKQLKSKYQIYSDLEILGPAEAPLAKLRGQFRYHLILKGPTSRLLNLFFKQLLTVEKTLPSGIKITLDVDPMNLL